MHGVCYLQPAYLVIGTDKAGSLIGVPCWSSCVSCIHPWPVVSFK